MKTDFRTWRAMRLESSAAMAACLAVTAALCPPAARGDELITGGRTIHRVQIANYNQGQLEYRTGDGTYDKLPIWQVEFLGLDSTSGVADLSSAEEYMLNDRPAEAVDRYERARRSARDFWPGVIRARLLMAADRAGMYEQSVRAFLAMVQSDLVAASHLLPGSAPAERTKAVQRALKLIDRALAEDLPEDAAALVNLLHYDALRKLGDPAAAALAATVAVGRMRPELATPRTVAVKLAALTDLLAAGRSAETVSAIDSLIADAAKGDLAALLLLKAEALYQQARSDEDYLRSALPAMRVAIHYADSASGCAGLVLAAQCHEAAHRIDDAVRLWRRCLIHDAATDEIRQRARTALARLSTDGAS